MNERRSRLANTITDMKITSYTESGEAKRKTLYSILFRDGVLPRIRNRVTDKRPLGDPFSNDIYEMACAYYDKYQEAPKEATRRMFERWARKHERDKDKLDCIEMLFKAVITEYERSSPNVSIDVLVDDAFTHINWTALERHKEKVAALQAQGKDEEAIKLMPQFKPFTVKSDTFIRITKDRKKIYRALEGDEQDVLVHYPDGPIGEFFGHQLARDNFVAFMGPEKRGKSFFLQDVAHHAWKEKRRTLFYSVGDMSEKQMLRRVASRIVRCPYRDKEWAVPVKIRNRDGRVSVKTRNETTKGMDRKLIDKAFDYQEKLLAYDDLLQLQFTPNTTKSVADIESDVIEFVNAGWVPDVIVIDYADILAPEPNCRKSDDRRDQIDERWRALRRLSQTHHCLVVTATQTNATSYEADLIRRKHFADDKRKFSHVTGIIGINQNEKEKDRDIFRLNWLMIRDSPCSENRCVHVAGCLAIANPMMVSTW